MSVGLRRFRALVYVYTDAGTGGETAPTYVLSASGAADSAWWVSKALPTGRENTTGMKPEHRIDAVLEFSAAAPVTENGAIVIDNVEYLVRAILPREHGRAALQVYAERSQDGLTLVATPPIPAFMTSGAWWDSTTGLSAGTWVDRVAGLSLAAIGTPSVVTDAINGESVARCDVTSGGAGYGATAAPLGADPSAFSLWALAKVTPSPDGVPTVLLVFGSAGFGELTFDDPLLPDLALRGDVADESTGYASSSSTDVARTVAAREFALVELYLDDKASSVRVFSNGVGVPADTGSESLPLGTFALTGIQIGATVGWSCVVDLAHAACVPFALTTLQRQTLYDWLTAVYGLTLPAA